MESFDSTTDDLNFRGPAELTSVTDARYTQ